MSPSAASGLVVSSLVRGQHISWEGCRPEAVVDRPAKPSNPLVARFEWKLKSVSARDSGKARRHFCHCQQRLREVTHTTAPVEPEAV